MCEQLTKEIMELKSRRRELEAERHLFHQKTKRAKSRVERKGNESTSDTSNSSRSVTPAADIELQGSSSIPAASIQSLRHASTSSSPFPASPGSTTGTDHSVVLSDPPSDTELHF